MIALLKYTCIPFITLITNCAFISASNDVNFYLSSQTNGIFEVLYNGSNPQSRALYSQVLSNGNSTVVLVHGWLSEQEPRFPAMRDAYLQMTQRQYNIIRVSWTASMDPNYFGVAAPAVQPTGARIAQLFTDLNKAGLQSLQCVGHSLGAHVCANFARALVGGRLSRIFGLDPAGPAFTQLLLLGNLHNLALRRGDADMVITLRTNAGEYGSNGYLGDVNFSANNGRSQPGCADPIADPKCSHLKALDYHTSSISHTCFVAQGQLPIVYGPVIPNNTPPGNYTFHTTSPFPYCPVLS